MMPPLMGFIMFSLFAMSASALDEQQNVEVYLKRKWLLTVGGFVRKRQHYVQCVESLGCARLCTLPKNMLKLNRSVASDGQNS